jgi:fumarate hydratase subunit alpha
VRLLDTAQVVPLVSRLARKACCSLDSTYTAALAAALEQERSPYGRDVLQTLIDNAAYAQQEGIPCCQDTGICSVYMEIGQEVAWAGAPLSAMVNEGVRQGYTEGFLRKSMVRCPLDRENTGDNTPAVFHPEIVEGDGVKITVFPKGGGCENNGAFTTLLPDSGERGIVDFVLQTVDTSGGKSCPPLTIGVGVGGTMDWCCHLAKRALLRAHGTRNPNERYARLEREMLDTLNTLGIGPMGTGGTVTALDVRIEQYPCHITALPVAVSLQCHAARQATAFL